MAEGPASAPRVLLAAPNNTRRHSAVRRLGAAELRGSGEGTDWQPEILPSSASHRKAARTQARSSHAGSALRHSARTWNRAKGTLISVQATKHGGSEGTAPLILNLGTTWR